MSLTGRWFLLLGLCLPLLVEGQVPAFPGAEGFGAMTTGGRGGAVIEVTNLNNSGAGSLRAAIDATGPRTVVFRVSGTIELQSQLTIRNGNITIAGQTAPGDGICLRGYTFQIDADNVIVRYIRCRLGDEFNVQDDAMNGRRHKDIIIDHCSMSWSVDECASFYDNENFTLQWSILSESLYESTHDKGRHGYGGIWGGKGATFHHNLLAHHTSRNPRFCGSRYSAQPELEIIDHRNNVIYNWGGNSCYGAEGGSYNLVNNYYKYGPATSSSKRNRIINPNADAGDNQQAAGVWGSFYISDNFVYGYPSTSGDNWTTGVQGPSAAIKETIRLNDPVAVPAITEHQAEVAFEHVLANAGTVLPVRDGLDARIVRETMTGTATYGGVYGAGQGIIDSQTDAGGWPLLNSTDAPLDTDHDGMPDAWEDLMGLDKNDPADRNGDLSGNGYTNLEDYLNSLAEAHAYILRPIHLAVDTVMGYAVTLTWKDISDNETGFVVERKEGDSWSELSVTSGGDTSYTDNSLSENGTYYYRLKAVNGDMESFYTDSVAAGLSVGLDQEDINEARMEVFPNPFSSNTRLVYTLGRESKVVISVLDMAGRHVMELVSERQSPGIYDYTVDGSLLENGIYLIRLSDDRSVSLKKVVVNR